MDVIVIIVTTIVVFIVVETLLRLLVRRVRATRVRKERERALHEGLKLDLSTETPSLKRVELEHPKARIMAIDDEKSVLDSLRKVLVLGGYNIDTVENGSEALELARRHDYDFVFTDLKMPGIDGVEVTRAMKHLRPDIDVIVITGYATIETAVETVKLGAADYVEKPFTEDELLEFVRTALARRQDRLEKQKRHQIHLVEPGSRESSSRFELNVPAGAFVSPQHAWARIELNGTARIGLDDLVRKIFGDIDAVELPGPGQEISRGQTLFSVIYEDRRLDIAAPLSGKVISVNQEHADHPEWLAIKPFELSWMCCIEPSDLAAELPELKIGQSAVDWYRQELDRYRSLEEELRGRQAHSEPDAAGKEASPVDTEILARFSAPFIQG